MIKAIFKLNFCQIKIEVSLKFVEERLIEDQLFSRNACSRRVLLSRFFLNFIKSNLCSVVAPKNKNVKLENVNFELYNFGGALFCERR